jgi:hypothetical protein
LYSRAAAPSCIPAPDGLVGWWTGDGSAVDIAGTNNGVLIGGATANAPGVVGMAFDLDGTNALVRIPDSPALRPTNLTIEAWVLFRSLNTTGTSGILGEQYIVFHQNSRLGNFEGYFLGKSHGTNRDFLLFEVTSAAGQTVEADSVTGVVTGAWYHVAGVRGTNFLQIYVNGQLETQVPVNFPQDYGNYPLYFGSSGQPYWDRKFNGLLDEVSLYNRALSADEIAAIYNAGSDGKCKPGGAGASLSIALSTVNSQTLPCLTLVGQVNQTYGIQFSTDLTSTNGWIGATNLTLTTATNVWCDPQPPTDTQRFYRAVPGPISIP